MSVAIHGVSTISVAIHAVSTISIAIHAVSTISVVIHAASTATQGLSVDSFSCFVVGNAGFVVVHSTL